MRKLNGGFTLIEVMIVVVIIGILAAIAYPSYTSYVEKARRADAKAALLAAAQRLERCYTQNNSYEGCPLGAASPDEYYVIAFAPDNPEPNAFVITATPQGAQANSPCGTYTFTSTGPPTVSGDLGTDLCW